MDHFSEIMACLRQERGEEAYHLAWDELLQHAKSQGATIPIAENEETNHHSTQKGQQRKESGKSKKERRSKQANSTNSGSSQQRQQAVAVAAAATQPASGSNSESDVEELLGHDEDLKQINTIISLLEPLKLDTLKMLAEAWMVEFDVKGDHMRYRTNITERIRYLAAMNFVCVAEKYRCLPSICEDHTQADRSTLINNVVLYLWQSIHYIASKFKDQLAILFDLEASASSDDICTTLTGLGITSFFGPLPPSLVERVVDELDLSQSTLTDPDAAHESNVHQICCYLYPNLRSRSDMKLRCTAKLAINEFSPGSFSCTVHNASMLNVAPRSTLGCRFSCNRIRWRGHLKVFNNATSFSIFPFTRGSNYRIRLVAKTSEARGNRKHSDSGNSTPTSLYKESEWGDCTCDTPVSIDSLFSLQDAWNHPQNSPNGLRLYNKFEDKIVFQVTIQQEGKGEQGSRAQSATQATPPPDTIKNPKEKQKKGKNIDELTEQQLSALLELEEDSKKKQPDPSKKQKIDKRLRQLEAAEQQAREKLFQSASHSIRDVAEENGRVLNRMMQKKKERDRKQELQKLQPNTELQAQVQTLQSSLSTARSQLSKVNHEKATVQKENDRLVASSDAKRQELAQIQERMEALQAEQEDLEKEHTELLRQREKKEKKAERRRSRREALESSRGSNHGVSTLAFSTDPSPGNAAAIRDFQSFWSSADPVVPATSSGVSTPSPSTSSAVGVPNSAGLLSANFTQPASHSSSATASPMRVQSNNNISTRAFEALTQPNLPNLSFGSQLAPSPSGQMGPSVLMNSGGGVQHHQSGSHNAHPAQAPPVLTPYGFPGNSGGPGGPSVAYVPVPQPGMGNAQYNQLLQGGLNPTAQAWKPM